MYGKFTIEYPRVESVTQLLTVNKFMNFVYRAGESCNVLIAHCYSIAVIVT